MLATNLNYCPGVVAVMVTHNPNSESLRAAVRAVAGQVSQVVVIDNASANFRPDWLLELVDQVGTPLHLLPQSANLGIGAGHNIGIRWAQGHGADFVLLLDQDSQVEADMVARLQLAYADLTQQKITVAGVGPRYHDSDSGGLSKFVKVGVLGFTQLQCEGDNAAMKIDFLISSGSLLSLAAIDAIGLMDESLFIDHVDTEWCFRAGAHGFQFYGVCDAVMTHALGEHRKEFWFTRQRMVPFHSPFRYYYMFRNSVLLYRRSYMPLAWKLADIQRCLKIAVFFGLVAPNRFACLKMMALGLIDGFKGVSGKKPERP